MNAPTRRRLLASVGPGVFLSGCANLDSSDHPSVPSARVDVTFRSRDGAEVARLRVVDVDGTIGSDQVRIRVGDVTAYARGEFRGQYGYSERFENEWADGLTADDVLRLSTGAEMPADRRLVVQVTTPDVDDWVTVEETPTP